MVPPSSVFTSLRLEALPAQQRQKIDWPEAGLDSGNPPNYIHQRINRGTSESGADICWHYGFCRLKLNTAENQVLPKHIETSHRDAVTPSSWNIKTAKLQRALAICCGRQRAAKCFVKSTKVKKPHGDNPENRHPTLDEKTTRGHSHGSVLLRKNLKISSQVVSSTEKMMCPKFSIISHMCLLHAFHVLVRHFPRNYISSIMSHIGKQEFSIVSEYFRIVFHHVPISPRWFSIEPTSSNGKKNTKNHRQNRSAPHLDVDEWLAPVCGLLPDDWVMQLGSPHDGHLQIRSPL